MISDFGAPGAAEQKQKQHRHEQGKREQSAGFALMFVEAREQQQKSCH